MSRFVNPFVMVGNGVTPFDGAQFFFYDNLTTNPKASYSNAALTIPSTTNVNGAVVADSRGIFPDIYIGDIYTVVWKDKNGVQIDVADYVQGAIETPTEAVNYYVTSTVDTQSPTTGATSVINGIDTSAQHLSIFFDYMELNGSSAALAFRVGTEDGIISAADYAGLITLTKGSLISGSADVVNWGGTFSSSPAISANTYAAVQGYKGGTGLYLNGWVTLDLLDDNSYNITISTSLNDGGGNTGLWTIVGSGNVFTGNKRITQIELLTENGAQFSGGAWSVKQYANTGTVYASGANPAALAEYGDNGDFYIQNGSANAFAFIIPTDAVYRTEYPPLTAGLYTNGTKIRFKVSTPNTWNVTAQLGTGPVVPVTNSTGGANLAANTFIVGPYYELTFNSATGDFNYNVFSVPVGSLNGNVLIDATVNGTKLIDGTVDGDKLIDHSVPLSKLENIPGVFINFINSAQLVSGTSYAITSIPACRKFELVCRRLSLTNGDEFLLQIGIGPTPTYIVAGYVGNVCSGSSSAPWSSSSAQFTLGAVAADQNGMTVIFTQMESNMWQIQSTNLRMTTADNSPEISFGEVNATAPITAVKLMSSSTGTFDNGYVSLNILG